MNWEELVDAVAVLSVQAEQQLIEQAHQRRAATIAAGPVPGPGTEQPPVPAETPAPPADSDTSRVSPADAGHAAETDSVQVTAASAQAAPTAAASAHAAPVAAADPTVLTPPQPVPSAAAETVPPAETPPSAPAEVSRPVSSVPPPPPAASYTSFAGPESELTSLPRADGVPTMAEIREKIEGRAARAEGQAILDEESRAGQQRADDEQARAKAAQEVLDRIRASLHNK